MLTLTTPIRGIAVEEEESCCSLDLTEDAMSEPDNDAMENAILRRLDQEVEEGGR